MADLKRSAMRVLIGAILVSAGIILGGCASPAWQEYPEFARFRAQARGKYIGCFGYSLELPGCEGMKRRLGREEVFVIPGTGDNWDGEASIAWNSRARAFARSYNEWRRELIGE